MDGANPEVGQVSPTYCEQGDSDLVRGREKPELSTPGRVERAWTLVRTGSIANCNLTKSLESFDFSLVFNK